MSKKNRSTPLALPLVVVLFGASDANHTGTRDLVDAESSGPHAQGMAESAEGTGGVGAETNPTGNPIGGGPGYNDIKSPSAAQYVVSDKPHLLKALASATRNQVVYLKDDAEIDLTGEAEIVIPAGVTLASGRGSDGSTGALLFSAEYEADVDPLFIAGGDGARVTGLRLKGPHTDIGDDPEAYVSWGVWSEHKGFEVDNCELWGWAHGAVYVDAGCTGARIHHNYIHHNRRDGYGYGVVLGYSSEKEPIEALIEANLFDFCRHSVASTGKRHSSYTARYNMVLEHAQSSSFDRHGTVKPGHWVGGDGGDWTIVYNNTVRLIDELAVGIRGVPVKGAQIHHNWFYHPDAGAALWMYCRKQHPSRYSVHDNFYGQMPPGGTLLPAARPVVTPSSGKPPLSVQLDGSTSSAPDGRIRTYEWDFGDGESATDVQATHVYNRLGRYNVTLRVTDDRGVLSQSMVPVTVYPAPEKYVLDFWVRDSYRGSLTGYYRKEALIDGTLVWRDDVAGDDGWQHVTTDITELVRGKDSIGLDLRVFCARAVESPDEQIIALDVFWDDVVLFGADLLNGDFETNQMWSFSVDGEPWNGGRYAAEAHTGVASFVLGHPYGATSTAGSWAEVSQVVEVPTQAVRGEWRFDEKAGVVALDSSPYHHDAALVNVDDSVCWVDGIMGAAIQLDGIDDLVDCTDSPNLKSTTGAVEFWMKPNTLGRAMSLLSIADGGTDSSFVIGTDRGDRIHVLVRDRGTIAVDLTSTAAIRDVGNHHVAVTQAGTAVAIFIDGKESGKTGINATAWTGHLGAGRVVAGAGYENNFYGTLDQLVIYSEPLTAKEIRSHYDQVFPRGVWHLDEGKGSRAADSSIFANDGRLVRMDTTSCWVAGKAGTALSFDGVDDTVDCGDGTSLRITDAVTIALWVKFDSFGEHERLLDNNLYSVYHRGGWAGDVIYFLYRIKEAAASGDSAWDNWGGISTETDLKVGKWYHLAAVKSGDRMRIYLNGVKEKEIDCLYGYNVDPSQTSPLYMGTSGFEGTLDEITIIPRAFTDDEVLDEYLELR